MIRRALMFTVALVLFASAFATASELGLSRQEIRSMNILDRPYRPFHFYGNAVRRRYHRASAGLVGGR
jgi:hypothetical protein